MKTKPQNEAVAGCQKATSSGSRVRAVLGHCVPVQTPDLNAAHFASFRELRVVGLITWTSRGHLTWGERSVRQHCSAFGLRSRLCVIVSLQNVDSDLISSVQYILHTAYCRQPLGAGHQHNTRTLWHQLSIVITLALWLSLQISNAAHTVCVCVCVCVWGRPITDKQASRSTATVHFYRDLKLSGQHCRTHIVLMIHWSILPG